MLGTEPPAAVEPPATPPTPSPGVNTFVDFGSRIAFANEVSSPSAVSNSFLAATRSYTLFVISMIVYNITM
jgi:hypothetical protein